MQYLIIIFEIILFFTIGCKENKNITPPCTPACEGRCCGDDGCGGTCADSCGLGQTCDSRTCTCQDETCIPLTCESSGKSCGTWEDGCGGSFSCPDCPQDMVCSDSGSCEPRPPVTMRLLQANIGNLDLACMGAYKYNCCRIAVEQAIARNLAALAPDVVTLQEVVSTRMCAEIQETDPGKVCHPDHLIAEPAQARRLLGSDYTIACDSRHSYECVGVHVDFGSIPGCPLGGFCETLADTASMPEGCDDGFSVSAVTVAPHRGPEFRLGNAHPPSGPTAASCRSDQVLALFEGSPAIPALLELYIPGLAAGDFNLDPFSDSDESVETWNHFVGDGRRFHYHSGPAEHVPPYDTSFSVLGNAVYDHVVSDFADGVCQTLGQAPGTERLDGGSGCDHAALWCTLTF